MLGPACGPVGGQQWSRTLKATTRRRASWEHRGVEYVRITELQQRAEELVRRAQAGEWFGIIVDGRLVAWLAPPAPEANFDDGETLADTPRNAD